MNAKNSLVHFLLFFPKLILNLLNFEKDKHTEFSDHPSYSLCFVDFYFLNFNHQILEAP